MYFYFKVDPQDLSRRGQQNSGPITIDSTREESLRTQYVPPEPKLKILARPKGNRTHQASTNNTAKGGKPAPAKTLQQVGFKNVIILVWTNDLM